MDKINLSFLVRFKKFYQKIEIKLSKKEKYSRKNYFRNIYFNEMLLALLEILK